MGRGWEIAIFISDFRVKQITGSDDIKTIIGAIEQNPVRVSKVRSSGTRTAKKERSTFSISGDHLPASAHQ